MTPNVLSQACQGVLDLVVCGHSCGCVVALALAFRLEASGLGLRGLVALDRRSRTLSHVSFGGFAARHYPCRLRVWQLTFVAPLVPLACLPVRPFSILASVAAEPGGMTEVCHMLDTNHYTMPFSHAWDLAAMIRGGVGRAQRRRRREPKRNTSSKTESNRVERSHLPTEYKQRRSLPLGRDELACCLQCQSTPSSGLACLVLSAFRQLA